MRHMGEYPPGHFLQFSGKPVRGKSSPQTGFISLRLTTVFAHHGSHPIPRRVRGTIYTLPTQVSYLAAYRIMYLNLSVNF